MLKLERLVSTQKKKGVGVVVGRFQTPWLHDGHKFVLNCADSHEKMLVVVGVHRAPGSFRNELDFETRRAMIRVEYPNAIILPLLDQKRDDYWSKNLDDLIKSVCLLEEATFYHGRLSFISNYFGGVTSVVDVGSKFDDEATPLRERCYKEITNSPDFRAGQFYYSQQVFPRINPCIDLAITKEINGELCVVLGNRSSDPDHWRFPGGHVDRTDKNMEQTCRREADEETNVEIDDIKYISSYMVDDWRNTRTNGTLTTFFYCKYVFGALQGGDDIMEAKWFPVKTLKDVPIVSEHKKLVDDLLNYLEKVK